MNKQDLAKILNSAKLKVVKHGPEILMAFGITGMVTTTVLAVKATPKALDLIDAKKKEKHLDELPPLEVVKAAWKCYIPSAIVGTTSIACLIGANSVHAKRHTALVAAYKLSETALTEYHEKVLEAVGEKKEQVIRDKVHQEKIDKNPVTNSEVFITGNGDSLCLDPLSKRYFECDVELIRRAENNINKQLLHDICGSASLNEFYDELGLERTDVGDSIGWNTDHLISLDIYPGIAQNGRPCLVIGHHNAPKWDF